MGEFFMRFIDFLKRPEVQDAMLGKRKLMSVKEICERGKGYINEKSSVVKRCVTMLKSAVLVCSCMLAVASVLFLKFESLLFAVAFYLSVCILILTDFIAYRFDYERRFNIKHPAAIVGRVVTGVLSVGVML